MGLLDAPQRGDDAGLRTLLTRVSNLETQLQQAMAALSSVRGLIAAQTQIAATVARLAAQTQLVTLTNTMAWNSGVGTQAVIDVPDWASHCFVDGGGETTASTIPSGQTLLVDLWADAAPITAAAGVWIGEASGYDAEGDVSVFVNVLDVTGADQIYLRPVKDNSTSDAAGGSISFNLALRVMWI